MDRNRRAPCRAAQKLFFDTSFAVQATSARNKQLTVGVKYAF
jgi:hypothetical protein